MQYVTKKVHEFREAALHEREVLYADRKGLRRPPQRVMFAEIMCGFRAGLSL